MGISLRGGAAVPEVSFSSLAVVASVAFAVPLFLGAARSFRMPEVALEILLGIVIGPSVLGWVKVDVPVQVLALVGVAFILLLRARCFFACVQLR
jgi:Kef-type K+ transport system membrane component KefB